MLHYTAAPSRFPAMKIIKDCRGLMSIAAQSSRRTFSSTATSSASSMAAATTATTTRAVAHAQRTSFVGGSGLLFAALRRAGPQQAAHAARCFSTIISSSGEPNLNTIAHRRGLASSASPVPKMDDSNSVQFDAQSHASLLNSDAQRTPLLDVIEDPEHKREYIREYFHTTYNKGEDLFSILKGDAPYYIKSEPLRHPPIFYLGHTACFYINKLLLAKTIRHRVNPKIEHMCAVGVDEMSWDDLNTDHYDWPSVSEVMSYRHQVRDIVDNLIRTLPMDNRLGWDSEWWPILMGIEHDNIHTETSSAIFRQIDLKHIDPNRELWPVCPIGAEHPAPQNELVDVAPREVVFNKTKQNAKYYGWDNEFGQKVVQVEAHRASKYLVSNEEFLEFVQDGGYNDKQFWTDEGWTWVSFEKQGGLSGIPKDHPRWWVRSETADSTVGAPKDSWKLRTLQEEIAMPWSWPACVNQLEAAAFCKWKSQKEGKSIRLPSEPEWFAWRDSGGEGYSDHDQPDWAPSQAPGNINLDHFASECPVDMFAWGKSGLYDVVGNVWQWTESPIDALPGYETHRLYDDFSSPTFDGLHSLIKGGSFISIGCNGATKDSRYSFRRHFYQHAGFRYVESSTPVDTTMTVMEHDEEIARELDAHFTIAEVWPGMKPFQVGAANLVKETVGKLFGAEKARGLRFGQVGCSVGRACFELANAGVFDDIVGFDQTASRLQHAVRLQNGETARFVTPQDGEIQDFHSVDLDKLGFDAERAAKIHFAQSDACNIDVYKHGTFDVLLAANVLERLYAPSDFLNNLHSFVNPGGIVVMSTTCDWNPEVTPKENWIGGYKCSTSGENVHTNDTVENVLAAHFDQLEEDICLPSAETQSAKTFTVRNSHFSVWQRRS